MGDQVWLWQGSADARMVVEPSSCGEERSRSLSRPWQPSSCVLLASGGGGYRVTATFDDAGQLVKGNQVKVGGVAVGSVKDIDVTPDGRAAGQLRDLRRRLRAAAPRHAGDRQAGVAVGDRQPLRRPDARPGRRRRDRRRRCDRARPDRVRGRARPGLQPARRRHAPVAARRRRRLGDGAEGRGEELREGVHYLNPALSTGSRLFEELSRDDARLRRFLVDSSQLVGRAVRAARGPHRRGRQPQHDLRRARPARRARWRSRSTGCRRSCVARTRPSSTCAPRSATSIRWSRRPSPPRSGWGRSSSRRAASRATPARRCATSRARSAASATTTTSSSCWRASRRWRAPPSRRVASTVPSAPARSRRPPTRSPRRRRRSRSGGRTRRSSSAGWTTSRPPAPTTRSAASRAPGST